MLLSEFIREKIQAKRGTSLRGLAMRAGIDSGHLSRVIGGKRPLTQDVFNCLAEGLKLRPREKQYLKLLMEISRELSPEKKDILVARAKAYRGQTKYIPAEDIHIFTDWDCLEVMVFAKMKEFRPSLDWLLARMDQSRDLLVATLCRLKQKGILQGDPEGQFVILTDSYSSTDDIAESAIQKFHELTGHKAITSLSRHPVNEREFQFVKLALPKHQLVQAKERIRNFVEEFATEFEAESSDQEIYNLNVQFFK